MELQISLQAAELPSIEDVMSLIQFYMTAVQALQNNGDSRYKHFNTKIYNLMAKNQVLQQLQNTQIHSSVQTLKQSSPQHLADKRSKLDLQLYLQKDNYTLTSIKEMLKKEQKVKENRVLKAQKGIQDQKQTLEQRIQSRRRRSISKGRQKVPPQSNYQSKAVYRAVPRPSEATNDKANQS